MHSVDGRGPLLPPALCHRTKLASGREDPPGPPAAAAGDVWDRCGSRHVPTTTSYQPSATLGELWPNFVCHQPLCHQPVFRLPTRCSGASATARVRRGLPMPATPSLMRLLSRLVCWQAAHDKVSRHTPPSRRRCRRRPSRETLRVWPAGCEGGLEAAVGLEEIELRARLTSGQY